jgi:ubiquinone/menaquinone biosynthesis C-methylase UbiE
MIYQFWNSSVLRAGIKLGLFSLIEKEQPCSPQFIADSLNANSRFMESFLESCVVLGLLEKSQNKYRNSKQTSEFLVPHHPNYIGDLALHVTNHWLSWGNLDQLIIEGRTEPPFENHFVNTSEYWKDYMLGQHNRAESGQSDNLVRHVDLFNKRKLLDLGGGMGSYAVALCKKNPELQALIVDQKEPLKLAAELITENNLNERISIKEGDFHTIALEKDYDVVLISGIVCIKSENESRKIFHLAYEALQPGGTVIVQDFMRIGDDPQKNFLDTMMDLYLKIAFAPEAGDFEGEEVVSWLKDTGFIKHKQILLPTQLNLIVAEKPL